ncbi:MAG: biotin/lipoyl-binding protein, partial [Bacteroidales bacterium]
MSKENSLTKILPGLLVVAGLVVLAAVGGYLAYRPQTDLIQGQADVTEYRVSSKVPGRILELRVKEGDFVHRGDTLARLEAPDVAAKLEQASAARQAAEAQQQKADKGARAEQKQAAYEMWQKAKAATAIA